MIKFEEMDFMQMSEWLAGHIELCMGKGNSIQDITTSVMHQTLFWQDVRHRYLKEQEKKKVMKRRDDFPDFEGLN